MFVRMALYVREHKQCCSQRAVSRSGIGDRLGGVKLSLFATETFTDDLTFQLRHGREAKLMLGAGGVGTHSAVYRSRNLTQDIFKGSAYN